MIEIARDYDRPLRIDARFIEGLRAAAANGSDSIYRAYSEKLNLPIEHLKSLVQGDIENNDEETGILNYEFRQLSKDVEPKFRIMFKNGLKITSYSFDEFNKKLDFEPESIESISFEIRSYEHLSHSISVGDRYGSTASISVSEKDESIDRSFLNLEKLIKLSESPMPFLHTESFRFIVAATIWIVCVTMIVIGYYKAGFSFAGKGTPLTYAMVGIVGGAIWPMSLFASAKLKDVYPRIEFALGYGHGRNLATRAFWGWLIGIIIAPTIFLVMGILSS